MPSNQMSSRMVICYTEDKVMSVFYEGEVYWDESIEDPDQWPFYGTEEEAALYPNLQWMRVKDNTDFAAEFIELVHLVCEANPDLLDFVCLRLYS